MALKVLSALETSKITVPTPSDTTDAATKGYVEGYVESNSGGGEVQEATTERAGVVTLANPEASPISDNEGKVPTLDIFGKLDQSVIPTGIVNGATGVRVTSFGGQNGSIDVDSQFFQVQAATNSSNAKLALRYDSRYLSYEAGAGLSLQSSIQTTLSNASHLYFIEGTTVDWGNSVPTYASSYKYYSPDVAVPFSFGMEELPTSSYIVCQESLAPVFTVSTSYAPGNVVSYCGWLYRCVFSTSSFDPEQDYDNWERVTLSDTWGRSNLLNNNKQVLKEYASGSSALSLADSLNGSLIDVSSSVNTRTIVLSSLASGLAKNEIATYEIMIRCASGSATAPKLHFRPTASGSDITFLGTNPGTDGLERGYIHFIVLRNFPVDSNNTRQWVGNIQGKVPLPSQS